jgi:hypothetical protein
MSKNAANTEGIMNRNDRKQAGYGVRMDGAQEPEHHAWQRAVDADHEQQRTISEEKDHRNNQHMTSSRNSSQCYQNAMRAASLADAQNRLRDMYLAGFAAARKASQETQSMTASSLPPFTATPSPQRRTSFLNPYNMRSTEQDPNSCEAKRSSLFPSSPPPPPPPPQQRSHILPEPILLLQLRSHSARIAVDPTTNHFPQGSPYVASRFPMSTWPKHPPNYSGVAQDSSKALHNSTNVKQNESTNLTHYKKPLSHSQVPSLLHEQHSQNPQADSETRPQNLIQPFFRDLVQPLSHDELDEMYSGPELLTPPSLLRRKWHGEAFLDFEAMYATAKDRRDWIFAVQICKECLSYDPMCTSTSFRKTCQKVVAQDKLRFQYREVSKKKKGDRDQILRDKIDILCQFAELGDEYPDGAFQRRAHRVCRCAFVCGVEKILRSETSLSHYTCQECKIKSQTQFSIIHSLDRMHADVIHDPPPFHTI